MSLQFTNQIFNNSIKFYSYHSIPEKATLYSKPKDELMNKLLSEMSSNCTNDGQKPIHIQEQSPYETLDPATARWINQIKFQWAAWRKSCSVTGLLNFFFSSSENAYESALKAMVNSGDFYSSKQNSLAYYIMEYFSAWKRSNNLTLPVLTKQLKIDAFKIVIKQKNQAVTNLVADIFEMKADKYIFLEEIHALIQRNMYKEACRITAMLELHDKFGVEEFIIPLIFQCKFNIAQEILNGSVRLQVQTAQYLDNIFQGKNIRAAVHKTIRELQIFDPKVQEMGSKPLSKLLERIITLYKIPVEICPNLMKRRGSGALQFLIRKRFIEKNIGVESWSEMVEEIVGNDHEMQLELVKGVAIFGDKTEAKRWADKYEIPDGLRPYAIQAGRGSTEDSSEVKEPAENWEMLDEASTIPYHRMALAESQIHLIDSVVKFENFVELCVRNLSICGIDCEWKPTMGLRKCGLALIQIATFEAVYIIDVLTLLPLLSDDLWECFYDRFFLNDNLLKIGFSLDGDFSVIQSTVQKFSKLRPVGSGYLDLLSLSRVLVNKYNFEFPFTEDRESSSNSESLTRLVQLTLGKKLDKSDQFSNWERRPLRKSQIMYAALDGYCLLEVYDVLRNEAERQKIPFLEVVSNIRGEETMHKKLRKKSGTKMFDE